MRFIAFSRLAPAFFVGLASFAMSDGASAQASFFEQIFGLGGSQPPAQSRPLPRNIESVRPRAVPSSDDDGPTQRAGTGGGTYRTVCVRACDGFYFPVSFATTRNNFSADQQKCQASCKDAQLFAYKNPGEGIEDALDLSGRPYTRLPNAFKFRKVHVEQCGCRPAPWTEAELQRHKSYAAAETSTAAKIATIETPAAGKEAAAQANPLAVAATEAVKIDKTGDGDAPVEAPSKPETTGEKKPRAAQKTSGAKVIKVGVSGTTASPPANGGASSGGGGFGVFSMGLGAQPQYTWPGDAPRRR